MLIVVEEVKMKNGGDRHAFVLPNLDVSHIVNEILLPSVDKATALR
jgi:hypothetical protein